MLGELAQCIEGSWIFVTERFFGNLIIKSDVRLINIGYSREWSDHNLRVKCACVRACVRACWGVRVWVVWYPCVNLQILLTNVVIKWEMLVFSHLSRPQVPSLWKIQRMSPFALFLHYVGVWNRVDSALKMWFRFGLIPNTNKISCSSNSFNSNSGCSYTM